ncbi:hypothetical protein DQW50_03730 [Halorubrum sp. 48-1-W]|uniref:hypothetical protein n=1 Tax=Halorubrum sp. 48-1-W TaxID=2249761 RepID=UPI000DCF437A|nr:hypothetical protein [Halorubrum sp. 48-1-W]RAW46491.1 hypothetical protein DQW50_03730 [Halorubrum sp. 48-1-W]
MSHDTGPTRVRTVVRSGSAGVSAVVEQFAFWTAIAFPAVYVGLAVFRDRIPAFGAVVFALLVANAVVLLAGHTHEPGRSR